MKLPFVWLCSAWIAVLQPADGAECGLPNAVLPADRKNITIEGVSMPFGIGMMDWVSGRLIAYIADVLLKEVVGLNTEFSSWSSSVAVTYALLGCTTPTASGGPEGRGCSPSNTISSTHVALEVWDSATTAFFWEAVTAVMGDTALPVDLGSVGYDGMEGLYVPTKPRLAALETAGLALEYYRSYNDSWHNTSAFFQKKYSDISLDGLRTCSYSKFSTESKMRKYLEITNDTDGVEMVDGRLVAKCLGGLNGSWWFSPACRHDPSTCIPVIDGGDGWATDDFMQKAAAFNMPLALAVGTWDKFVSEPVTTDMLFYWWVPDNTFISLRPTQVTFPPTNKAEWAEGIKTTDSQKVALKKRVHHAISDVASRASELLSFVQLTPAQLDQMLLETATNPSKPETEIACDWLKANHEIWTAWVPYETKCTKGWGLINAEGDFVLSRESAVQCEWCPPGMYAKQLYDSMGLTATCVPCEKGRYQPNPGQLECLSCEPGKFAGEDGMRMCEACPVGTYADNAGSPNCTTCGGGAKLWTTMRKLTVRGEHKWVSADSATSKDDCGCDVGARYDDAGVCVECMTEGLDCLGMGDMAILPGYYSPVEINIFKCGIPINCKGGPPGKTCAEGREGIACASCESGLMPVTSNGGACVPCTGTDKLPFALLVIFVILACILVYWFIDRGGGGQPTHAVLLVGISGGLFVALMQQLSVVNMLDVVYVEPLDKLLRLVQVFTFNVELYIHLSCFGEVTSIAHFVSKVCLIFAACLFLAIIHFFFVVFKYQRRFRERFPSLVAVFGTTAMVFYISVTVTILQPLQCTLNPNGHWTTIAYQDVICWEPDIDSNHQVMLAVGLTALLMPILLFVKVFQIVMHLPRALKAGDTGFMRSYGFLFFRFRPQSHWYILVVMTRSLFIGMIPMIPMNVAQIYALQLTLLLCFATCIYYQPWRVPFLNFMDVFFGGVMVLFMNITAFSVKETNLEVLGWVCVCMVAISLGLLGSLLVLALLRHCGKLTKPYQFFLCHCKAEAGAFARWLKLELASKPEVKQEVFLDSDNLESLDSLLGYVAADVSTLVVLASKTIFFRPWCVGEMTTAHTNAVNNIVLEMPDFEPLSEESINDYENLVPDLESLCVDNGITLQAVRQALTVFSMRDRIGVPTIVTGPGMATLAKMLISGKRSGTLAKEQGTHVAEQATPMVGILRDRTGEANAIAFVLHRLMVRYTCFTDFGSPEVLCMDDDQPLPSTLKKTLVLCTHSSFNDLSYLNRLCELSDRSGTDTFPVIGDDEFRVPRPETFMTFPPAKLRPLKSGAVRNGDMLARVVATLFKEIAVPFKAKIDRYIALDAAASRAAKRLMESANKRGASGSARLRTSAAVDSRIHPKADTLFKSGGSLSEPDEKDWHDNGGGERCSSADSDDGHVNSDAGLSFVDLHQLSEWIGGCERVVV